MLLSSLFEGRFQRFDRPPPLPASHPGYHRFHQPEDPEEPPLGRGASERTPAQPSPRRTVHPIRKALTTAMRCL